MNVVGLAIALLSAIGFSVSTSLQHHANETLHVGEGRGAHLLALLRRPRWVTGQVLALVSFTLHAVALKLAPLVLVQPVVVSGIVLAVPVRAALERQVPHRREMGAVAVTAAALSLFLVSAHPASIRSGDAVEPLAVTFTVTGAVAAVGAIWWARRRAGVARAAGYGVAAGLLFGLTAGLLKLLTTSVSLTGWPIWVVPVIGLSGVVLNQQAYRAGPLSASMPVLNVVDVLLATAFGVVVFGEVPAHRPWDLAGQVLGGALMLVGLRWLAREHAADGAGPTGGQRPGEAVAAGDGGPPSTQGQ